MANIIEEFVIASGKRKISLQKWPQLKKPWQIHVYVCGRNCQKWVLLSTAEYFDETNARKDFEIRRPRMHEETVDMPMQKGKRLIQEVMTEKLGPND